MESLPWSKVFEFLGGDDVVKALMTSKHNNPWKVSGNDHQQSVVLALKNRLMATDKGRQELAKAPPDFQQPFSLSKLLFSVDNGLYLRYDGVYVRRDTSSNKKYNYHRFYPTGEVIIVTSNEEPDEFWYNFCKEDPDQHTFLSGTYQYADRTLVEQEYPFWVVSFSIAVHGSKALCYCRMGKSGKLSMHAEIVGSGDNPDARFNRYFIYTFCPCKSSETIAQAQAQSDTQAATAQVVQPQQVAVPQVFPGQLAPPAAAEAVPPGGQRTGFAVGSTNAQQSQRRPRGQDDFMSPGTRPHNTSQAQRQAAAANRDAQMCAARNLGNNQNMQF